MLASMKLLCKNHQMKRIKNCLLCICFLRCIRASRMCIHFIFWCKWTKQDWGISWLNYTVTVKSGLLRQAGFNAATNVKALVAEKTHLIILFWFSFCFFMLGFFWSAITRWIKYFDLGFKNMFSKFIISLLYYSLFFFKINIFIRRFLVSIT